MVAARAEMRAQIDRLERQLGMLAYELGVAGRSEPLPAIETSVSAGSPRLLSLAELEALRDELFARVCAAEQALEGRLDSEARARETVESMIACPSAHRFEVVERAALGEPGCGAYQVRPRMGLLGMLFGWWCVKLSSGCP
jgi:hypothetical protein